MQGISIKRAKITNNGQVEATWRDSDGNSVTFKGSAPCHVDLEASFAALTPFFAELTEQKEADLIDWRHIGCPANEEELRHLAVTGIALTGSGDSEKVTLTGKRSLLTRQTLNIVAPATALNPEAAGYSRGAELASALRECVREVEMYVTGRKRHDDMPIPAIPIT